MSALTVRLFAWLQGADFYRAMHAAAADALPDGDGRAWLDVGCGPGVLTRMAADKGYSAKGVDRDPRMIETARRLAAGHNSPAQFAVSDVETLKDGERYDVVSASSLLIVASNPETMLQQLLALTKPGGSVLIIEAAAEMTRARACSELLSGKLGRRGYMLLVWAMVRSGRTLPEAIFHRQGLRTVRRPLLGGLASAWVVECVPPRSS
jgi:ubiquinone/menaquinone biosynthesis C-methylase UbiE